MYIQTAEEGVCLFPIFQFICTNSKDTYTGVSQGIFHERQNKGYHVIFYKKKLIKIITKIMRMRRQVTDWEKIYLQDIDKGLATKIHKELLNSTMRNIQLNSKNGEAP